ncbi:MAG: pyridoxal phosphate-dependent class II aminotransferase [Amylibacter sp.]|nr:pyridoxal phosphate-dependent class II aminotransferase [Amylibacter sp.]|tara:strand:- start:986 stop:1936 length:951 start_codon:yes stop_codon:yes gene_type:complete
MPNTRDHGGGLDDAILKYGGNRTNWLDLSTGINPIPYPIPKVPNHFWHSLPDSQAQSALLSAARKFWKVPNGANIIASSGVSQLIAMLPSLLPVNCVEIIGPTYNEHAAAFQSSGWTVGQTGSVRVIVHPNNPDGNQHVISKQDAKNTDLMIIDESFCDVTPDETLINLTDQNNVIVLKGLGKFWGLAGLRLGFAVAAPELIKKITDRVGPWAISGPAQFIGQAALTDNSWIIKTRSRLREDSLRLDNLMIEYGNKPLGGTDLFRLYEVKNATKIQNTLAKKFIWTRIFPYSRNWLRLGIPGTEAQWAQLINALEA